MADAQFQPKMSVYELHVLWNLFDLNKPVIKYENFACHACIALIQTYITLYKKKVKINMRRMCVCVQS